MSTNPSVEAREDDTLGLFGHLPTILWQRRWLVMIPLWLCGAIALAFALLMKPVYRSTAVLVVESQQLPTDLVNSPVTDIIDQRVARVRQQVLSRPDLITLIQRNGLYPKERQTEALSTIIEEMRDATTITPISANIGKSRQGSNTIAFSMSFDYEDPIKAQLVVQQFVSRFLELDSSGQNQQAQSTVEFLEDQAGGLRKQIAELEARMTSAKAANGAVLSNASDSLAIMTLGAGGADSEIAALSRENIELAARARQSGAGGDAAVQALRRQLAEAQATYSDSHPDVITLRNRLAEAERVATPAQSGGQSIEQVQIAMNRSRIQQLMGQRASAMGAVGAASAARARGPAVEEQIMQLERQADGLRMQYDTVATKLLGAQTSARMEEEQKGERLSVTDPPAIPDKPESPNRPLILAAGTLLGLAIGCGLALAIEMFKRPVRGVQSIEMMLGVPPLVVIPTIRKKVGLIERLAQRWHRREARA